MRFPLHPPAPFRALACATLLLAVSSLPLAASPQQSTQPSNTAATPPGPYITIPGPLRSFLRMAAISQKVAPDEVLPLLARNVVVHGYRGTLDNPGKPTEFLSLLMHYLDQAKELRQLAGPQAVLEVPKCEDAKPLLAVLGYRMRQGCGGDVSLETADPDRAFLTIDSGFPLAQLEETLRGGKSFRYDYPDTPLPVLLTEGSQKTSGKNEAGNGPVLDSLLGDPAWARLYWAMSRIEPSTRATLQKSVGLRKLLPLAAVLDFYGSYLRIRNGRVMVPGGTAAEPAWKSLAGASPESPPDFVLHLLSKDEGWLAAYFDTLWRVPQPQQSYFVQPARLQRYYEALRGRDLTPSPARPVFRPDPGLLLLMTRVELDPSGQPRIPGDIATWREIVRKDESSRLTRDWGRRSRRWETPEQVIEGMVGLSRVRTEGGPLQVFLTISEVDRGRDPQQRLTPQTVRALAQDYARYQDQYRLFAEFHQLSNDSILRFLKIAESLDKIPDRLVKANAIGIFQANLGLWQILARQGQIPDELLNNSWQRMLQPFATVRTSAGLFDASRASLGELLRAATGTTALSQDEIIALLAGPRHLSPEEQRVRHELAARMRSVMQNQRLVSLDTIFALGDGLNQMAEGKNNADSLIPLAGELREFEMPKPLFSEGERYRYGAGRLYNNPHTTAQMRTDLAKVIKSSPNAKQIQEARGQLTPFLRDALVGLNYAYYEMPGSQMLHNNPLLIRSHDFSGTTTLTGEQAWQSPRLLGVGQSAGGGAHLVGSLADLPYTLARAEQDFIVPENVQALIWEEMVPTLLTSAVLPRWWGISRNEMHAVALYQRAGEELIQAAARDEKLRASVMDIVGQNMAPLRAERIEAELARGDAEAALAEVVPSETFFLTAEFRHRFPNETRYWGDAGRELAALIQRDPEETSLDRLSQDFGVPHPALAQSYGLDLFNLKPFPAFMGYASRLLGESWDSTNLFWARLADEQGYAPVMLNELVPQLTRRMVEKLFATSFEDWPALLRAMRETGTEFRQGKVAALTQNRTLERP